MSNRYRNGDLPRHDNKSIEVRIQARNQCSTCNVAESKANKLEIHQIVPRDEAENQLSNYILLCEECHNAAHNDERRISN